MIEYDTINEYLDKLQFNPDKSGTSDLIFIQKNFTVKNIYTFRRHLKRLLRVLILYVNHKDPSIRFLSKNIMINSVYIIFPYYPAVILRFIKDNASDVKPEQQTLFCLLEMVDKIIDFMEEKKCIQYFNLIQNLFILSAESSSEIVSEEFNLKCDKFRCFLPDKDKREVLIRGLCIKKESNLSTKWDLKSAAVLCQPDLIEFALSQVDDKNTFCSYLQSFDPTSISNDFSFEEILMYINNYPHIFCQKIDYLRDTKSSYLSDIFINKNHKEIFFFYSCYKIALLNGFDVDIDPSYLNIDNVDFNIRQVVLECCALRLVYNKGTKLIFEEIDHNALKVFSSIVNLSTNNSNFLSYVLDNVDQSPLFLKNLILLLTKLDFRLYRSFKNICENILFSLVKNDHPLVQESLRENLRFFDCCNTEYTLMKVITSIDYTSTVNFVNGARLVSTLASRQNYPATNIYLTMVDETDDDVYLNDYSSLCMFLKFMRKICTRSKRLQIPFKIVVLPQLVISTVVKLLTGREGNYVLHFGDKIDILLEDQPIESLLKIKDLSCGLLWSFKRYVMFNEQYENCVASDINAILRWPSKYLLLLYNKKNEFCNSLYFLSSANPVFKLSGALSGYEKLPELDGTPEVSYIYAMHEKDFGELTVELVRYIDKYMKKIPSVVKKKMKEPSNIWKVVFLRNLAKCDVAISLIRLPFHKWDGPKEFWDNLPQFLVCVKNTTSYSPAFNPDKCDKKHQVFAFTNIHLFNHKIQLSHFDVVYNKPDVLKSDLDLLSEIHYIDQETIRSIMISLHDKCKAKSFKHICATRPILNYNKTLMQKIVDFINEDYRNGTFNSILLLLELIVVSEEKDFSLISSFLNISPFRCYTYFLKKYDLYGGVTINNVLSSYSNGNIFTENELLSLVFYVKSYGINVNPRPRVLSNCSKAAISREFGKNFYGCYLLLSLPPYTKENEIDAVSHINSYGMSKHIINIMFNWVKKGYKPLELIKKILEISFKNRVFYDNLLEFFIFSKSNSQMEVKLLIEAHETMYDICFE